MFQDSIFKAYDIRGEYGKEFNADFAWKLGTAFARYAGAGSIIVGRDERDSSPILKDSVIQGMTQAGVHVIDIGVVTVPLFYFSLFYRGLPGIMVTASHLGLEYNGFKLVGQKMQSIYPGHGMEEIRKLFSVEIEPNVKSGSVEFESYLQQYANFVIKNSGLSQSDQDITFAINGPMSVREELAKIFESLKGLSLDAHASLIFHFDTDADRLRVEYEGEMISADKIAALLILATQPKLWGLRKRTLVHDLRFSRSLIKYLNHQCIRTIRSRVGRVFIQDLTTQYHAEIGAELSGHICLQAMHGFESPLLAMLKILKIISQSQKTLPELLADFPKDYTSGEINIPISPDFNKDALIKRLAEHYRDTEQDRLDGLTIEADTWWFNVRFSNTEPVLRLVVGAESQELLQSKIHEVQGIITQG